MDVYLGPRAYSVTVRCAAGRPFTDSKSVSQALETLESSAVRNRFKVLAYCFMPDHLHLLLQGDTNSFLPELMKDFKQRSGYAFKQKTRTALWQKSYYDHVLRSEEAATDVARYIFANPVRAGLVASPCEYPYSGSCVWGRSALEA